MKSFLNRFGFFLDRYSVWLIPLFWFVLTFCVALFADPSSFDDLGYTWAYFLTLYPDLSEVQVSGLGVLLIFCSGFFFSSVCGALFRFFDFLFSKFIKIST